MRTALRVLTDILDHVQPDPADVEELRRLSPKDADGPLDLLACKVVQDAVAERRQNKDCF